MNKIIQPLKVRNGVVFLPCVLCYKATNAGEGGCNVWQKISPSEEIVKDFAKNKNVFDSFSFNGIDSKFQKKTLKLRS